MSIQSPVASINIKSSLLALTVVFSMLAAAVLFTDQENFLKSVGMIRSASLDETTCDCPSGTENCSIEGDAVMGGLDFVQYHTNFKLDDGTYNETMIGTEGSSEYTSTYNGFKFYFISKTNQELFERTPSSFVPQYGGFCSWGITGESCPPYPWDKDCLGPAGNWAHWTIYKSKLYFFLSSKPKSKFLDDPETYVASGDERWLGWFNEFDTHFSTSCYLES